MILIQQCSVTYGFRKCLGIIFMGSMYVPVPKLPHEGLRYFRFPFTADESLRDSQIKQSVITKYYSLAFRMILFKRDKSLFAQIGKCILVVITIL